MKGISVHRMTKFRHINVRYLCSLSVERGGVSAYVSVSVCVCECVSVLLDSSSIPLAHSPVLFSSSLLFLLFFVLFRLLFGTERRVW